MDSSTIVNTVANDLANYIESQVDRWYGVDSHLVSRVPRFHKNVLSVMFTYVVRTSTMHEVELLAKIPTTPEYVSLDQAIASDRLRQMSYHDYKILQHITQSHSGLLTSALLTHVRPLAYFNPHNAVITEKLKSHTLLHEILQFKHIFPFYKSRKLEKAFYGVGEWLRLFHMSSNKSEYQKFDTNGFLIEIEGIINSIQDISDSKLNLDDVYKAIKNRLNFIENENILICGTHRDFQLSNILLSDDSRIAVIDFGGSHADNTLVDVATLLSDLTIRKRQIMSFGMLLRYKLHLYEQSFLNGYYAGTEIPVNLLILYCSKMILSRWLRNEYILNRMKGWKKLIARIGRIIIRSYFLMILHRYLDQEFTDSLQEYLHHPRGSR